MKIMCPSPEGLDKYIVVACKGNCGRLLRCHIGAAAAHGKFCDDCRKEATRIHRENYAQNNREKVKKKDRKYYSDNKDAINARRRKRYAQLKERQ